MSRYRLSIAIALIITIATLVIMSIAYAIRNGVQYTQQYYRPIIGGIQIQLVSPQFLGTCSIGYVVRDPNGNLGFITAGHCSNFARNWSVYQPAATNNTYYVDTVTWVAPQPGYDVEFIQYSNVDAKVLYATNSTARYLYVLGGLAYYSEIDRQVKSGERIPVNKTGRSTGTTGGVIYHAERSCSYGFGYYIYYCLYTTLYSEPGDSGSPVFKTVYWYNTNIPFAAYIVGHAVASNCNPQDPLTIVEAIDAITNFGYNIVTWRG